MNRRPDPRRKARAAGPRRDAAPAAPLELAVTAIAQGGAGVAHVEHDGVRRAVFVPATLPDERVRADVDFSSRPARGRLLEVLTPAATRTASPCPDVARCGACALLHVDEQARRDLLAGLVREALPPAVAGLVRGCEGASPPLGYRSRARLHVTARRGRVRVGFHAPGTHDIVEVERCVVLAPALDAARARLAGLFVGADGRGDAHLALGRPSAGARAAVLDTTFRGELPAAHYAALEGAVREGWLDGARTTLDGARLGSVVGDPRPFTQGADGAPLELAIGGFAQASEVGNTRLARLVKERVDGALALARRGVTSRPRIVELHAGAGNFTVLLGADADVHAVESAADAVEAARRNLAARGLGARVVTGDAETADVPAGTDLVLLDPPRTGAPGAVARLAARRPPAIVYVSCDARTLARDLEVLLGAGYAATSVDVLDLFPATAHVETVTVLVRGAKPARGARGA